MVESILLLLFPLAHGGALHHLRLDSLVEGDILDGAFADGQEMKADVFFLYGE